jgi:hypothetical protein
MTNVPIVILFKAVIESLMGREGRGFFSFSSGSEGFFRVGLICLEATFDIFA